MGLAIATITSMHTKRNLEDVKSNFFVSLGDYHYNTSKIISTTSEAELHVFLKIWNPIFTKIHHREIFHCDNYKYKPQVICWEAFRNIADARVKIFYFFYIFY